MDYPHPLRATAIALLWTNLMHEMHCTCRSSNNPKPRDGRKEPRLTDYGRTGFLRALWKEGKGALRNRHWFLKKAAGDRQVSKDAGSQEMPVQQTHPDSPGEAKQGRKIYVVISTSAGCGTISR